MDFIKTLDNNDNVVIQLSSDYRIIAFNKAAEVLNNCHCEHVIGANYLSLCLSHHWESPLSSKKEKISDWTVTRTLNNQNRPCGFVIVGHLKSSQKKTEEVESALLKAKEQAEIANQTKADFLANISHDLRTPLNGILGMAQTLKIKKHAPEQEEFIDAISQAGTRLLYVLEDILNFSNLRSEQLEIKSERFHLKRFFEDLVKLMSYQADQKNLQLHFKMAENVPNFVMGDQQCLRLIFVNLLSNAIKFTDEGIVHFNIACVSDSEEEAQMVLTVTDTGIGIPKDKMTSIFDQFSRLDPTFRGRYHGIGLGLAIVKQLIDSLGGAIEVKSELGKGSVFTCQLTFKLPHPRPNEGAEQNMFLQRLKERAPHVLLVEDDKIAQRFTSTMLEDLGCQVDIADSGANALAAIDRGHDVIFMDIGLPDSDGFTVTKQIREQLPQQPLTPIIALTAHVEARDKEKCLAMGMNDFLKKPVSQVQLSDVLSEWLF